MRLQPLDLRQPLRRGRRPPHRSPVVAHAAYPAQERVHRQDLRESRRPVMFQPVYIGYEKLMEGKSYIGELSGGAKQKETLFALRDFLGRG